MLTSAPDVEELNYAAYQSRQEWEVSLSGLTARAPRLQPAGKYHRINGLWQPSPYPGHAVVSMVADRPENQPLQILLATLRDALGEIFPHADTLALLPLASHHQTLANTLSAERYEQGVLARGLASRYPKAVAGVFSEINASPSPAGPVAMSMIGLSLFGTSLGVLGTFAQEEDYGRIQQFRQGFYGHPTISSLGIRRTRPFIGHVTLAYLERPLQTWESQRLVEAVADLNRGWPRTPPIFYLARAELRAYAHLAEFSALPDLPAYRF